MEQPYIVSARKYRPASFETVVGQRALTETLRNAIRSNHLAHAYLFCGPRGVGKTTCARIFAKTINCLNPTADHDACNECESCRAFNEQRSYNIHELDAASNNSVEDIRSLIEQVRIPPQIGKYSVYIIDEVHMLSQGAFNALLKTLEEPPSYAVFILATTEKHKVLPTILSRCQVFDFARMTVNDTVHHLQYVAEQEGIRVEEEALHVVAQKADGGMRDALSIFDQLITFCGNDITYQQAIEVLNVLDSDYYFRVIDAALSANVQAALLLFNDVLCKGFDGGHFVSGLASHLRDVLVSKDPSTTILLETSDAIRKHYAEQAQKCSPMWIFRALEIINQADINYRTARNKRLTVELMLVKLCSLLMSDTTSSAVRSQAEAPQSSSVAQSASQSAVRLQASQIAPQKTSAAQAAPQKTSAAQASPQKTSAAQASPQVSSIPNITPTNNPISGIPGMPGMNTIPGVPTIPGMPVTATNSPSPQSIVKPNTPQNAPSVSQEKEADRPFTVEQMTEAWNRMSHQLFAADKRLAAVLTNTVIEPVSDTTYIVLLQNIIQEKELTAVKSQILQYLRAALHNSSVQLQFKIREQDSRDQTAYTAEDRYRLLAKDNKHLIEMKEMFNLILD